MLSTYTCRNYCKHELIKIKINKPYVKLRLFLHVQRWKPDKDIHY